MSPTRKPFSPLLIWSSVLALSALMAAPVLSSMALASAAVPCANAVVENKTAMAPSAPITSLRNMEYSSSLLFEQPIRVRARTLCSFGNLGESKSRTLGFQKGPPANSKGTSGDGKGPVPFFQKEHIANEEQTMYSADPVELHRIPVPGSAGNRFPGAKVPDVDQAICWPLESWS